MLPPCHFQGIPLGGGANGSFSSQSIADTSPFSGSILNMESIGLTGNTVDNTSATTDSSKSTCTTGHPPNSGSMGVIVGGSTVGTITKTRGACMSWNGVDVAIVAYFSPPRNRSWPPTGGWDWMGWDASKHTFPFDHLCTNIPRSLPAWKRFSCRLQYRFGWDFFSSFSCNSWTPGNSKCQTSPFFSKTPRAKADSAGPAE
jgi:hypothetical protein